MIHKIGHDCKCLFEHWATCGLHLGCATDPTDLWRSFWHQPQCHQESMDVQTWTDDTKTLDAEADRRRATARRCEGSTRRYSFFSGFLWSPCSVCCHLSQARGGTGPCAWDAAGGSRSSWHAAHARLGGRARPISALCEGPTCRNGEAASHTFIKIVGHHGPAPVTDRG
jgi:hypothetical protein